MKTVPRQVDFREIAEALTDRFLLAQYRTSS